MSLGLRTDTGIPVEAGAARWLSHPPAEEERLLAQAVGPVLDVGCGPGRHVVALAQRGVAVLGIDITPAAVGLARRRGGLVLERSVFDHIPGDGRWATVLLLDGNVGIGGDPLALLMRVARLLRPGGRVLAELDPPGTLATRLSVRLEHSGRPGPRFEWGNLGVDRLAPAASAAGLGVEATWCDNDRWFASLLRL